MEEQLEAEAGAAGDRTVVALTHFAPTMDGTSHPRFAGETTNHLFATDLTSV